MLGSADMNTAPRTRTFLREYLDARMVRYTSVAKALGISPSYLHMLMEGDTPMTQNVASGLSSLFGDPITTFLPSAEETNGSS